MTLYLFLWLCLLICFSYTSVYTVYFHLWGLGYGTRSIVTIETATREILYIFLISFEKTVDTFNPNIDVSQK